VPSFIPDPSVVVTGDRGQRTHHRSLEQTTRLARQLYVVRPGVWTLVGNGLSNQTFIAGPEGVIVIDTGECVEEMASALHELRAHTEAPVAAILYTHFHYVGGTQAVLNEAGAPVPVFGHERIANNIARVGGEIAPAYSSGLVHQFGLRLPAEGPDAIENVGLGMAFRNPDHAPFTTGHIPVTNPWRGGEVASVGGLQVEVTHAPSDADDSVTLWFPESGVCVQNLVWPTLFNIFAIRGEEYRDPQLLLKGIDHLIELAPQHLLGTHGPPISGKAEIRARLIRYRDAIQFLWDQTVRGLNRGWTADRIAHAVRLPAACDADYLTTEFYGVAEHHVRQIAGGIRGWFDGDTAKLFPLEPVERADRLVRGFGGAEMVRDQAQAAREANDLRWALELATWLAGRSDAEAEDRQLLADTLRDVGYRTTAANIRNWCLTRARDLDGSGDLSRLREHRLRAAALLALPPWEALNLLRVLVDPQKVEGIDHHIAFDFTGGGRAGLHIRNGVSVATDGTGASTTLRLAFADLAAMLEGKDRLGDAIAQGRAHLTGDNGATRAALAAFDLPGLGI
jgi:alkyl sulfatase BDS1-like metallo-beta-lactamase superfamily hydrolase